MIENAHWIDEASLALTIARQAVSTAPVLMLLVHRTEMDISVLSALASSPQQVDVVLSAMPGDDVAELVREQLGAPATPLLLSVVQELAQGICRPNYRPKMGLGRALLAALVAVQARRRH